MGNGGQCRVGIGDGGQGRGGLKVDVSTSSSSIVVQKSVVKKEEDNFVTASSFVRPLLRKKFLFLLKDVT